MNIISWNVRGMNISSKQHIIRQNIQHDLITMMLIQETKCSSHDFELIMPCLWKKDKFIVVDAERASGGINIAWYLAHIIIVGWSQVTMLSPFNFIYYAPIYMVVFLMFMVPTFQHRIRKCSGIYILFKQESTSING